MLGTVGIEKIRVSCIIGVHPHERLMRQELFISLRVRYDFARCAESDSLHDAMDYTALAKLCEETAHQGAFHLLETLAVRLVDKIMEAHSLQWAWVRIEKPGAIVTADYAFAEFERHA